MDCLLQISLIIRQKKTHHCGSSQANTRPPAFYIIRFGAEIYLKNEEKNQPNLGTRFNIPGLKTDHLETED